MTVNILAYVRTAELLEAALLVFRTLRVGFPTAAINVWGNALAYPFEQAVARAADAGSCFFRNLTATEHDLWVERMVQFNTSPFWICDTDVVFWDSMEQFNMEHAGLAGRLEPAFNEEFTGALHVERLHTALMYIDPAVLRSRMRAWMSAIPEPFSRSAEFPFVRQHFIPVRGSAQAVFYDTAAGLWQAGIGTKFEPAMDDCFDHLHCATFVDRIGPKLSCELGAAHKAIYQDHRVAKGMRHEQQKYYDRLAPAKGVDALLTR